VTVRPVIIWPGIEGNVWLSQGSFGGGSADDPADDGSALKYHFYPYRAAVRPPGKKKKKNYATLKSN
jgi:hypothetical protein